MASGPITSWQTERQKVEAVTDFTFLGSKITEDGDCSNENKRCLLLGRKAMRNLNSILKSRDITLLTKVHIVKATVFPIVIYGCESWTIKKDDFINAFKFWWWRRLLRVPWTVKRSNQSILKEINPGYWKDWCWSWSSNTLATWCKSWPIGKDPDAGKDWGQEEKRATEVKMVGWHHQLNGHELDLTLSEGKGSLECCSSWCHKE